MRVRRAGVGGSVVRCRWSRARKARFLVLFEQLMSVEKAAAAVGMTAASAHDCRLRDPRFAQEWDAVLERVYDELSLQVLRHAREGEERTETVIDGPSGTVRQIKRVHSFPSAMAMRLIVARRAEVEAVRRRRADRGEGANEAELVARIRSDMTALRDRFDGLVLDLDHSDCDEAGT